MMKQTLLSLIALFCFTFCSKKENQQSGQILECDKLSSLYIYTTGGEQPDDSLLVCESGHESTLALYGDTDSLCKTVITRMSLSIFKLESEKFAVIVDSSTNVYKWEGGHYNKIYHIECEIGMPDVKLEKIDINRDGHKDALLEIPSGGSFGSSYLCFFYNPDLKTLEYDDKTELRNVELHLEKRSLTCFYHIHSKVFAIEKYRFRQIEDTVALGFTTGLDKFDHMFQVTKFDSSGKIISRDTLKL